MSSQQEPLLQFPHWNRDYEDSYSRKVKEPVWMPEQVSLAQPLLLKILDHENGAAHVGIWLLLRRVAASVFPRGELRRTNGKPHSAESLAYFLDQKPSLLAECIDHFLSIEVLAVKPAKVPRIRRPASQHDSNGVQTQIEPISHLPRPRPLPSSSPKNLEPEPPPRPRPAIVKDGADLEIPSAQPVEKNGADPQNQACAEAATNLPSCDDDDPAECRLQRLFEQNSDTLTSHTLTTIRERLELRGVTFDEYIREAQRRLKPNKHIVSCTAVALDLATKFTTKTRPASMPKKKPVELPKCPKCFSAVGRGLVVSDDKSTVEPCACSTPEWVQEWNLKQAEHAARKGSAA